MARFKLKKEESEVVGKATFNKKEDFKAVVLLKKTKGPDGKDVVTESDTKVLHVYQADRLIKNGKAKEVKGVKIEEKDSTRTVKKLDK